jgi:hypothetical protein
MGEYMTRLSEYLEKIQKNEVLKVIVAVEQKEIDRFGKKAIEEAKRATVGKQTAYKHQPHFHGGEYHGHCDLSGGRQVSWTISGQRLHPNKFPADDKIPKDAKMAVARVLGVSADILEAFLAYDEIEKKEIILFELKGASRATRLLREYSSLIVKNDKKVA